MFAIFVIEIGTEEEYGIIFKNRIYANNNSILFFCFSVKMPTNGRIIQRDKLS